MTRSKFKVLGVAMFLAVGPSFALAATEIELKLGQTNSSVIYTYNRETCSYGPLGTIDSKNMENGVITTSKGSTKVQGGLYCVGKTMKGWKVTIKATKKGRSCGWIAINAPNLNGSAIGSSRETICLTVK
jgi:hypothetical protein